MPIIADLTLALIHEKMSEDGGNRFRLLEQELLPKVGDAYQQVDPNDFRSHLGASLIGKECPRQIWYGWRWAKVVKHDPRILRLFNRGHLEEARSIAVLMSAGLEVWQFDEKGKQFRIEGYKKHFGGSLDCVIRGLPELPNTPVLGEFKTHNDKSFSKLLSTGVEDAKFEHYVQMTLYMGYYGLQYGLYVATNKNDDSMYLEIIPFNQMVHERYSERAKMIIDSDEAPPRINNSPAWYQCKFCDFHKICHSDEQPVANCRTCRWVTPVDDAQWICENPACLGKLNLSKEKQLVGCYQYEVNPTIKAKV